MRHAEEGTSGPVSVVRWAGSVSKGRTGGGDKSQRSFVKDGYLGEAGIAAEQKVCICCVQSHGRGFNV